MPCQRLVPRKAEAQLLSPFCCSYSEGQGRHFSTSPMLFPIADLWHGLQWLGLDISTSLYLPSNQVCPRPPASLAGYPHHRTWDSGIQAGSSLSLWAPLPHILLLPHAHPQPIFSNIRALGGPPRTSPVSSHSHWNSNKLQFYWTHNCSG